MGGRRCWMEELKEPEEEDEDDLMGPRMYANSWHNYGRKFCTLITRRWLWSRVLWVVVGHDKDRSHYCTFRLP